MFRERRRGPERDSGRSLAQCHAKQICEVTKWLPDTIWLVSGTLAKFGANGCINREHIHSVIANRRINGTVGADH